MIGISQTLRDEVIVTVRLPAGGMPFESLVAAVRKAAEDQRALGNDCAFLTLNALYCLAQRGRLAFEMEVGAPTIFKDSEHPHPVR